MHPDSKKVWLVGVDMGYGHQRAARPLLPLAKEGKIWTANNYEGIPEEDRKRWRDIERFYNFISRFKGRGFLGDAVFGVFDRFQRISEFYPAREEHAPTFQLRQMYRDIRSGWGRHLVERLMLDPAPIVTTFFAVAHMADYWNYPAPVYAVVTDSDVSRAWVALNPAESKTIYFASSARSAARLLRYGVPAERVIRTGFPLPENLIGPREIHVKTALRRRLKRLDPKEEYRRVASGMVRQYAGNLEHGGKKEPPEIVFAVGGAGAQLGVAEEAIHALGKLLRQKKLILHLVAGVSQEVGRRFERILKKEGLTSELGRSIRLHAWDSKDQYFPGFEELIQKADILWTKPSELSFYAALGIPLLLTEPVGSHEVRNREWLMAYGAGIPMPDPSGAGEWLPDMIAEGRFAEAALNGFAKMERRGTANIREYFSRAKF